jgi:hypothetical protein
MKYWAGLHNPSDAAAIRSGADNLLHRATLATGTGRDGATSGSNVRFLEAPNPNGDDDDMMETEENT